MTARDEMSVGCVFFGAVTIEPFEVGRWRGGCGTVYGIWIGIRRGRNCFWGTGLPDQPFPYTGTDVLEERDGRVAVFYTFIDSGTPPVSSTE